MLGTEPIVERGLCISNCYLSLGSVLLSTAAQDSSLGPQGPNIVIQENVADARNRYCCRLETGTATKDWSLLARLFTATRDSEERASQLNKWWLDVSLLPRGNLGLYPDITPCVGVGTLDPSHIPSICVLYHFTICFCQNDCYHSIILPHALET